MEEYKVYRPKKSNRKQPDDPLIKKVVDHYDKLIETAFQNVLTQCLPHDFMGIFENTVCNWAPYDLEDYVRAFYITTGCVHPKDFCNHFRSRIERRKPNFAVHSFLTGDLDADTVYNDVYDPEKTVIVLIDISLTFDTAMFTALATRLTEEKRRVVFVFVSRHSIQETEPDSYFRLGVRSFNASIYSCQDLCCKLESQLECLPLFPEALTKHLNHFERNHRSCKILKSRLRMDVIKFAHLGFDAMIQRLLWKFRLDLGSLTLSWEEIFRGGCSLRRLFRLLKPLSEIFREIRYNRFCFIEDNLVEFSMENKENLDEFIELFCMWAPKEFGNDEEREKASKVSTNYIVPSPFDYEDLSNNSGHVLLYSILNDLVNGSSRVNLDEAYSAYSAGYSSLNVPAKIRHHDPKYHFQVILDTLVYRGVVEMDSNHPDTAVFVPQPSFTLVSKVVAAK